jgi:large subunit ribosomal protein L4
MGTPTYTAAGTKATTTAKLDATVFGLEVKNHELLKQAYLAHDANQRQNLAVTKTRGLVSGGGKKPWKQKGTGRARFGSSRVPIWRGGGVVFGPTGNENYTIKLHATAKRTAIRQALSLKAAAGSVSVIEDIDFKNNKTAEAVKLLSAIKATGNVVIVVEQKTPEVVRAFANLQNVMVCSAGYISVYNVLNADAIVITNKALAALHTRLATAKTAAKEAK